MTEIDIGQHVLQPNRQLLVKGEHVHLGPRALEILSILAQQRGEIVTKDELMQAVWGDVTVEENALHVHVTALRKALGEDAGLLHTIRGIGYMLEHEAAPAGHGGALNAASNHAGVGGNAAKDRATGQRVLSLAWVVIAAVVLLFATGSYFMLGEDYEPASSSADERIPVVVRPLSADPAAGPREVALAKGISDELIVRLRSISELQIATVQPDGSPPEGAFAHAYTVDGSVRSIDDDLRVVVRLSDPDGEILWSESFDRTLVDLLDLQRSLASEIATALNVPFDVGAYAAKNGGTDNPEAYAAYVRGMQNTLNLDSEEPLGHLRRAVQLDPDFVQARLGLANISTVILSLAPNLTQDQVDDLLSTIDEATAGAVRTNPDLAMGHAARGWYWLQLNNVPAAARELQIAEDLDPGNDLRLKSFLATFAQFMGRNQEGLALRRGAGMIDPIAENDPYLVYDLMAVGEYREATDLFERLERADTPGIEFVVSHAFLAYLMQGRDEDEALAFLRQRVPAIADTFVAARDNDEFAGMSFAEVEDWARRQFGASGHLGLAARASFEGYFGRTRNAMWLLRIAMERPGGNGNFYLWYPTLSSVRKMPEFRALVEEMGLVDLWRESGDWGDYCRPISETEFRCS